MVTTQAGEIFANTDQGVYALDTRFLSFYRLYINRQPLQVVNSSQLSFYASRFHLTNPLIETDGGALDAQTLRFTINRVVSEGIMEDEGCYAFGLDPNKKLITSLTSNAGQCLWSGIADPDKAYTH